MVTIANPIYDTVFKYLMEDLEIAKGLISTIINREIEQISVQPQEMSSEMENSLEKPLRVYRIDFAAIIKQADGTTKKVLIELQKTKRSTNIIRFRRYLAQGYQKEEVIVENGAEQKTPLEIITIYFLGFNLDEVPTAVLHVKNSFVDVTTGKTIDEAVKSDFIRLLNHESYTIQLKRLDNPTRSRLEQVLDVFNQNYKTENDQLIVINKESLDPLVQKMVNRLLRAIANEDVRRRMDLEDEIERDYEDVNTKLEKSNQIIEQQNKFIEEKDKTIEEKDKTIDEKDKAIEENKKILEENKKILEERERFIAELLKKINQE